jgi:hypothetical protein
LWISSLFLPVLVLERGTVRGWVILTFGLLGLVGPWLANLTFAGAIWSYVRGLDPRPWLVVASLGGATLLAVDGGGDFLVYGYGLGALAFGLAIAALWLATGLRPGSTAAALPAGDAAPRGPRWSRPSAALSVVLGTLVAVVIAAAAIVDGRRDRAVGNADEQAYLSFEKAGLNVAISRRGPVCTVPPYSLEPAGVAPPESIEVVQNRTGDSRPLASFVPLAWGLSALRLGDWDYRVVRLGDLPVVEVMPRGLAPVSAVVAVRYDSRDAGKAERLTIAIRRSDLSSPEELTWRSVGDQHLFAGLMTACPAIIGSRTPWAVAGSALGFAGATVRHPDTGFGATIAAFQGALTVADARVVPGSPSVQPCPAGNGIDRGFWTPELRVETRGQMAPLGRPIRFGGRVILLPNSPVFGNQFASLHCGSATHYLVDWGRVDNLADSREVGLRVHALDPTTGALDWSRYVPVPSLAPELVTVEDGWARVPAVEGVAEDVDDLVVTLVAREPGATPVSVAIRRPVPGMN